MAGKRDKPEDIVLKLWQVSASRTRNGISDAVRQIGATEPTYYRWRKQYGSMNRDQLKRLKELEAENQRLRRAVGSDLGQDDPERGCTGKLLSPSRRRKCIDHVRQALGISERLAHPRAAPLDATQAFSRCRGRKTADEGHHRACSHLGLVTKRRYGMQPVARIGDQHECPIHGKNRIAQVASRIKLDGKEIACVDDVTECGGKIISGSPPTRLMGDPLRISAAAQAAAG